MIEALDPARCTSCNICVRVCPTNVFSPQPGGTPRIARQLDCQTCFLCEVYCPEDALFVSPLADSCVPADEAAAGCRSMRVLTVPRWAGAADVRPRRKTAATRCSRWCSVSSRRSARPALGAPP